MRSHFMHNQPHFGQNCHFSAETGRFGRNWPVWQKLAGSADGSVWLLWFGDFEVQNFCFC